MTFLRPSAREAWAKCIGRTVRWSADGKFVYLDADISRSFPGGRTFVSELSNRVNGLGRSLLLTALPRRRQSTRLNREMPAPPGMGAELCRATCFTCRP